MEVGLLVLLGSAIIFALLMLAGVTQMGRKKSGLDHKYFNERWQHVAKHRSAGGDSGMQLSIIEADKLLDAALKQQGYSGQTMGERMKDARRAFSDNDAVWKAHKLRNRIAHEHDVKLTGIAKDMALRSLRNALKDLGAL